MEAVVLERRTVAQEEFEGFYRAQFPSVFKATFVASGDRDAAMDATQEAFKRAFARWRRLSKHDWAGGWVMTTALNVVKRGSGPRHEALDAGELGHSVPGPDPHRVDVAVAVANLPARQRTATILFYLGDFPLPAIAHLMGISEGAVKAHLAQARKNLRVPLEVSDV